MTRLDILQPNIIHGRPRAIRTLTKRARLFYYTKDSSSNENKYVDHLSFFLRKTTTTATLDKTEKDLLGPLLVRVSDLTNHLFICTTLCRLKNYLSDWGISSNGRAPALHAGGIGIDTRILHLVPLFFCLFFGKSLPCKVLTKHLFCKLLHLVISTKFSHYLTKLRSKPLSPQPNLLSEHLFLCQKGRKLIVVGRLFN